MHRWLARFSLFFFLIFLVLLGGYIAGVGFHCSDTCFHLAIGRWIDMHRSLPLIDPFSRGITHYATIFAGWPQMQHEWLAQLAFYEIWLPFGLIGLLVFADFIYLLAFVIIPLQFFEKENIPRTISLIAIFLTVLVSASRFVVRPEMFSFLFLSITIWLSLPSAEKIQRSRILALIFVFALWSNVHILFAFGIAYLAILMLCAWLDKLLAFDKSRMALQATLLLFVALAASLLNPWLIGVWIYFLQILTSPINAYIIENAPINADGLVNFDTCLYTALSLFYLFILIKNIRAYGIKKVGTIPIGLFLAGIPLGILHGRLIPFTALFYFAAIAWLYYKVADLRTEASKLDQELKNINKMTGFAWCVSASVFSIIGVILCSVMVPPSLPQGHRWLHPPIKAIEYLQKNRPLGNVLNFPLFGNIMDWYLPSPDVFIDSRFSVFEFERIYDYRTITFCQPGWENLLDKYKINWVFLPPDEKLLKKLADQNWHTVYQDADAVIMVR